MLGREEVASGDARIKAVPDDRAAVGDGCPRHVGRWEQLQMASHLAAGGPPLRISTGSGGVELAVAR